LAFQEFLVDTIELSTRKNPIDETREPRRAVEVLRVGRQHDLAPALPVLEAEWARAHGLDAEPGGIAFGEVARHDFGLTHGKQAHERHSRLGERDLHSVAVERRQPAHARGLATSKLARATDVREEVGRTRLESRVEHARERIDDVVGRDLAAVMEADTLTQG